MSNHQRVFPRRVILYGSVLFHARCEECKEEVSSINASIPDKWYKKHDQSHHLYRWQSAEVVDG